MKRIALCLIVMTLASVVVTEDGSYFNMTSDDMDKVLSCAQIVGMKIRKMQEDYQAKITALGVDQETANGKITGDMFETCVNKIDDKTVKYFFDNLTYVDDEWMDSLEPLVPINWANYTNETDYQYSSSQFVLLSKLQKSREVYEEKQRHNQNGMPGQPNFKIGNIDVTAIKSQYKAIIFLVVFAVFFLGIIYFLNQVMKKPKASKKKKSQ